MRVVQCELQVCDTSEQRLGHCVRESGHFFASWSVLCLGELTKLPELYEIINT